eukprot:6966753-Pyramimonas_sp.AAC.1
MAHARNNVTNPQRNAAICSRKAEAASVYCERVCAFAFERGAHNVVAKLDWRGGLLRFSSLELTLERRIHIQLILTAN